MSRRTFTLQMHDRPEGRAFTCAGCGAACMRDLLQSAPVCADCSPFLSVTNDGRFMVAVCRWADREVELDNYEQACDWAGASDIPTQVVEALRLHFINSPVPVRIVPKPPTRRNADHVYAQLDGNVLECPDCGVEPLVTITNVRAQPIYSLTGVVGTIQGPTTMKARCDDCRCDISYTLTRGGPIVTDQVWTR